jgi:diaminopimelate decarboxylase
MDGFSYRGKRLFAEGIPVERLADRHGTPLYVYSRATLRSQYASLAATMAPVNPLICYSVKANSNAAVLRTFIDDGAGLDIVSGGELFRGLRAGVNPGKVVFAGVGKTRADIEYALEKGILFFTVESEPEARRIGACAKAMRARARIAFRVNPDVDPKTHKYISTGKKENKFGLDLQRVREAYRAAARLPGIEIAGLHLHIGSQILSAQPFADALDKVAPLCAELKAAYPTFRYLDIGGGIGIRYRPDQEPLEPAAYAGKVIPRLKATGLSVVLEPGRFLVGNAGMLVCRVQYVKTSANKAFVIVDGGMNDLIRPSLYDAFHEVRAVVRRNGKVHGDLVGPICESGDFIALDRDLPAVREGDLVAVMSAGAYGFSMSSQYNSRPRAAEVMVDAGRATVVRRRETWEDLVAGETMPARPAGAKACSRARTRR